MKLRRVTIHPDELVELITADGTPILRVRVLEGSQGNTQVLTYTQPGARLHVDLPQSLLPTLVDDDPTDSSYWFNQ
jgi:hypothetical protein